MVKIIAGKSAIPEQPGWGHRESPSPTDYLEPQCVNYLEHSHPGSGFEYLVLTSNAIIKGAEFWAFLRQSGIPMSSPMLPMPMPFCWPAALAGQPGDDVTIATTNLWDLKSFPAIDAQTWDQIR